jgi:hypothetical protein
MKGVWEGAAEELRTAESIYLIGFSLSEEDRFLNYFFSTATMAPETMIDKIWVVNIDGSGDVDEKFKRILGGDALGRYTYKNMTFLDFVRKLEIREE